MSVKAKVEFFKQLLYLKEIVREQKISSAAAKNGIKAPNLSQMMKNLERVTYRKLFTRTSHGIVPTNEALKAAYLAEQLEKMLDSVMADMEEKSGYRIPKLFVASGLVISNLNKFDASYDITDKEEKADVIVSLYKPNNADQLISVQNNIGSGVIQNVWVCCRNDKRAVDLAEFIILQIHGK